MAGVGSSALRAWYVSTHSPARVSHVNEPSQITCLISFLGFAFLVSFPDDRRHKTTKSFLTPSELDWVIARVQADRGDAILEPFSFSKWLAGGADLKIWGFAFIFGSITTCTYAMAYFLPVILYEGMGFSLAKAQCLVAPPVSNKSTCHL